jgi:long-chain acyl-CoA synthetase
MTKFQELLDCFLYPASSRKETADKPAIIEIATGRERNLTYVQLESLIDQVSQAFGECKFQDKVLLCLANSAELVASILATWRAGLIAVPIDYRLTKQEIENIAERLNVSLIVTDRQISDNFVKIDPKKLPVTKDKSSTQAVSARVVDQDHCGLIILTSGTTGVPKAAVHSLGSLFQNIEELVRITGLTPSTSMIVPLPITHIIGLEVLLAVILAGGAIVFEDFVPSTFLKNQDAYKPTMLVGVPTIFGALLHPSFQTSILESFDCFFCGGAPLPIQLAEDFHNKFGKRIIQGYGATECKIITVNSSGPVGSVGSPIADTEIEIVDENDSPLPEGEIGEIRITGPSLMTEYLQQPDVTSLVLHNGHYHTGDLGFIKDGYVFISGRSKDMIIVAGNKVFPQEVEAVLRRHPMATEVAVVGLPHKKLGQIVKAIIVLPQGNESTAFETESHDQKTVRETLIASFRQMCAEHLKRELRPMDWEFRPASMPLPKTLSGKIDKKSLI